MPVDSMCVYSWSANRLFCVIQNLGIREWETHVRAPVLHQKSSPSFPPVSPSPAAAGLPRHTVRSLLCLRITPHMPKPLFPMSDLSARVREMRWKKIPEHHFLLFFFFSFLIFQCFERKSKILYFCLFLTVASLTIMKFSLDSWTGGCNFNRETGKSTPLHFSWKHELNRPVLLGFFP